MLLENGNVALGVTLLLCSFKTLCVCVCELFLLYLCVCVVGCVYSCNFSPFLSVFFKNI